MSTQCFFVRVVSHNFLLFFVWPQQLANGYLFIFLSVFPAVRINPRYDCYQLVCLNMLSISRSANYHPRSLASPTQKVQVDLRHCVFVRPKKNNKIIQGHCTCLQHTASGSWRRWWSLFLKTPRLEMPSVECATFRPFRGGGLPTTKALNIYMVEFTRVQKKRSY